MPVAEEGFADFGKPRKHGCTYRIWRNEVHRCRGQGDRSVCRFRILEFFDNRANLVCISAELPEEIDKRRAQEAAERAEEELRQQHSLDEYYQIQANLSRAMERLKIKNKHQI